MLVLSRKVGQTIVIGEDLVLQVVKVQGGRVKIAIQASPSLKIRRGELPLSDDDPPRTNTKIKNAEWIEAEPELIEEEPSTEYLGTDFQPETSAEPIFKFVPEIQELQCVGA